MEDNESLDDNMLEEIDVAIIPPEPDDLTDEDKLDENDATENANVNEFSGTYEVHGINKVFENDKRDEDRGSKHQSTKPKTGSNVPAPKWSKSDPKYLDDMTVSAEINTEK